MAGEVLGIFPKQPGETRDYDIDFTKYLAARADTIVSHLIFVDDGITVEDSSVVVASGLTFVKVFLSGGTDGESYYVSAQVTTEGGRVIEGDIQIEVNEVGRAAA